MTPDEFTSLAKRVEALEARPKDRWDKAKVVIDGLVPVMLAVLSAVIALQGERNRTAMAEAERRASEMISQAQVKLAEAQVDAAKVGTSVEKGRLLHAYVETLLNARTRTLAVKGIRLGLPLESDELLKDLSIADTDVAAIVARETKAAFPVFVSQTIAKECRQRGGSNRCIIGDGLFRTPPPDGSIGFVQVAVPTGAKRIKGILTEYSGSTCNGGGAHASIVANSAEIWDVHQAATIAHEFDVEIPANLKMLEFRVDALGDPGCDDPEWRDVRFLN